MDYEDFSVFIQQFRDRFRERSLRHTLCVLVLAASKFGQVADLLCEMFESL